MNYYAHKKLLPNGTVQCQTVLQHLRGTAERAEACLDVCGLGKSAYLAGILHDLGKDTKEFQEYLDEGDVGKRGSVIHTFQGCRHLLERYHDDNVIASELLAFAVGAHHGLFDCVDSARKIGMQYRMEKPNTNYKEAVRNFFEQGITQEEIDSYFSDSVIEIEHIIRKIDTLYPDEEDYRFEISLLARLLLSAVIEGDRHDTAAFMNDSVFPKLPKEMTPIWAERLQYMEAKLEEFPNDTPVAKARSLISNQCKAFAQRPGGIYRLNVPTGGGKTLASLRYALAHAEKHNKKRLIFTAPLLSILEQNAKVIRSFVGDDSLILEHHSNVVHPVSEQEQLDEWELLTQNWDVPIVITTMVQLLNTLFDGKTTSIRRFHALCDSVIVIDEVQTVPPKLLTLFNLAIRFLNEQCGATVVLCSATQPCLEYADHPLKETPADIVPYEKEIWKAFQRTEIRPLKDIRLDALPALVRELMAETDSLLVVCNKKDEAAFLLDQTKSPEWTSYHLSASMCMQHRRDTVKALQASLEKKEKTLCISTQVIEAGVDISFQRVLRLVAGMDSVVQSAGRCNRNGESSTPCPVYMVNCTDENLGKLQDIQRGKTASIALLDAYDADSRRFEDNLASDKAIEFYYKKFYQDMNQEAQDYPLINLDTSLLDLLGLNTKYADGSCQGVENYFLWQAFKTAGQAFSVFDEDTTDVLVPYGQGRMLVEQLCSSRSEHDVSYRESLLKAACSYTVSLYQYQKKQLEKKGALVPICGERVLSLRPEFYDDIIGIKREATTLSYWEV